MREAQRRKEVIEKYKECFKDTTELGNVNDET